MIDIHVVAQELQQARAVRMAAEEACCDIEAMLEDLERSRAFWQRLAAARAAREQSSLPLAA